MLRAEFEPTLRHGRNVDALDRLVTLVGYQGESGRVKSELSTVKYKCIGKIFTFKFVRFTFVADVSHTVNVFVTDIILNITSQEYLTFT